MADTVYNVETDLDPQMLTEVAIETYAQWLRFALGSEELGGRTLEFPSGRYAASISWRRTGVASVALVADEGKAAEALWLEEGHPSTSMKDKMLAGGKVAADGSRYRVIPMRADGDIAGATMYKGRPQVDISTITQRTATGQRVSNKAKAMWASPRPVSNASRFRTMTDKPGSSPWVIPEMPAYAPAHFLAELLRQQYGVSAQA